MHGPDCIPPSLGLLGLTTSLLAYHPIFDFVHTLASRAHSATLDVMHKGDALLDAQWDPLSESYLLVGGRSGTLHMYDVESKQTLQTFDQERGLCSLAWVPAAPGDFVTASDKTGLLKVWNVSQRAPRETIKAEAGPLHAISFIEPTQRVLCRFKSGVCLTEG